MDTDSSVLPGRQSRERVARQLRREMDENRESKGKKSTCQSGTEHKRRERERENRQTDFVYQNSCGRGE